MHHLFWQRARLLLQLLFGMVVAPFLEESGPPLLKVGYSKLVLFRIASDINIIVILELI
jgi:hypothetical protein